MADIIRVHSEIRGSNVQRLEIWPRRAHSLSQRIRISWLTERISLRMDAASCSPRLNLPCGSQVWIRNGTIYFNAFKAR